MSNSIIPEFHFGHIEDTLDERDFKLKISLKTADLPKSVDLREFLEEIRTQGNLGACTAFATTALVEFVRNKQKLLKWISI
jgi:C1A family cysteine protease